MVSRTTRVPIELPRELFEHVKYVTKTHELRHNITIFTLGRMFLAWLFWILFEKANCTFLVIVCCVGKAYFSNKTVRMVQEKIQEGFHHVSQIELWVSLLINLVIGNYFYPFLSGNADGIRVSTSIISLSTTACEIGNLLHSYFQYSKPIENTTIAQKFRDIGSRYPQEFTAFSNSLKKNSVCDRFISGRDEDYYFLSGVL